MQNNKITQTLLFILSLTLSHILHAEVTVNGFGEVKIAPTIASFSVNIETLAKTAKEAAEANAAQANKTMDLLKKIVPEDKAISTENFSIYPEYTYNNATNTSDLRGFKAVNSINVKTKDVATLGAILDQVISSGITTIGNLSFSHDNPEKLYQEALKKAFNNAQERAQILAQTSGITLKGVKTISIVSNEFSPRPLAMAKMNMAMEARATPTEAPEVATSATVEVVFKT